MDRLTLASVAEPLVIQVVNGLREKIDGTVAENELSAARMLRFEAL